MQRPPISRLAFVFDRFPDEAVLVRRLLLKNHDFRGICEDYTAARDALAHFRERPDAPERPEIADYETLLVELEAEIAALVAAARGEERVAGTDPDAPLAAPLGEGER